MQIMVDKLEEVLIEMLKNEEIRQLDRVLLNKMNDNHYIEERQYLKTLRRLNRYAISGEKNRLLSEVFKADNTSYHNDHQYHSDIGRARAVRDLKAKLEECGDK